MDKVRDTLFPGAGGSDSASADGIPWWMKYLCKAAAIMAGLGMYYKNYHYLIWYHIVPYNQVFVRCCNNYEV